MVVRRLGWVGLLGLLLVILPVAMAWSHCEIPCGIYDDRMRIQMIDEHIATIEKSMKEIVKLQEEKPSNYNQLVRWVVNKEDHANQLQEIVSQYFMTQRIKTDAKDYEKKVAVLHQLLVYAMKCKQTTDLSNTQKLRELIEQF
jgi:nickel superoxide dismutase